MKPTVQRRPSLRSGAFSGLLCLASCLSGFEAQAFPPAPHHLFYGMLRDEYGTPINSRDTEVILETSGGIQIKAAIIPDLEPGVNYRLEVPMDSALSSKLYTPTALRPSVPFHLLVKVGNTTFLPIEMKGDFAQLGLPGKRTHLDLTLGEDSDGDGLPDAWERLINPDIRKVNPNDDSDGDGITNLQEYLAGTYAFDPKDGFGLDILRLNNGAPVLEFLALNARTYTVECSSDLRTWAAVQFRIPAEGAATALRDSYRSDDVRKIQIEVPLDAPHPGLAYFRLIVH